jgi:ERF superfamily
MTDEPESLPALPATPMEMVARAVQMGADPTTLERLLALQERYEQNQARKAYAQAIAKARGEIGPIFKSGEVKMGTGRPGYRHAKLDDIERMVVPVFSKHGLSYRWGTRVPENKPDWVIVTCHVEHRDGHYEENSLGGAADTTGAKNPIQAIGSAVTYLCRYTVMAALGLSATDDDDDGRGAGNGEVITEQELVQMRERIDQVGQTESRVCDYYGVVQLEDLPRAKFAAAMKKLDASAKK